VPENPGAYTDESARSSCTIVDGQSCPTDSTIIRQCTYSTSSFVSSPAVAPELLLFALMPNDKCACSLMAASSRTKLSAYRPMIVLFSRHTEQCRGLREPGCQCSLQDIKVASQRLRCHGCSTSTNVTTSSLAEQLRYKICTSGQPAPLMGQAPFRPSVLAHVDCHPAASALLATQHPEEAPWCCNVCWPSTAAAAAAMVIS
jgi:hypothetical protein